MFNFSGFIDKGKKLSENVMGAIDSTVTDVGVGVKKSMQQKSLEMELKKIDEEINVSYIMIGKKYVEYLIATGEVPVIDVGTTLQILDPKLDRKEEIEKEILALEKAANHQSILAEKLAYEKEYEVQKVKLDKALAMEIITDEEYNEKLKIYSAKVEYFDDYKKIESQYKMGIIDKAEFNTKVMNLGRHR